MKLLFILIVPVLFLACSTPEKHHLSINHFETSEALGGINHASGELNYSPRFQHISSDRYITNLPTNDTKQVIRDNTDAISAVGRMGIFQKLDVILNLDNSPAIFRAKYQVLGDDRLNAKLNNFSTAIYLGYGNETVKGSESIYGETTPTNPLVCILTLGLACSTTDTYKAEYESHYKMYEVGVRTGYRLKENVLAYAGPTIISTPYSGTVKYSHNSAETRSVNYSSKLMLYIFSLGTEISAPGSRLVLKFEANFTKAKDGAYNKSFFSPAAAFGFAL